MNAQKVFGETSKIGLNGDLLTNGFLLFSLALSPFQDRYLLAVSSRGIGSVMLWLFDIELGNIQKQVLLMQLRLFGCNSELCFAFSNQRAEKIVMPVKSTAYEAQPSRKSRKDSQSPFGKAQNGALVVISHQVWVAGNNYG